VFGGMITTSPGPTRCLAPPAIANRGPGAGCCRNLSLPEHFNPTAFGLSIGVTNLGLALILYASNAPKVDHVRAPPQRNGAQQEPRARQWKDWGALGSSTRQTRLLRLHGRAQTSKRAK
jgi:hypothetical protein